MRTGICPKCGSTDICGAVNGLATGGRQNSGGISVIKNLMVKRGDTDDYVCLGCGFFEQYMRPGKALNWIGRHWAQIPVQTRTPERDQMPQRDRVSVQDRIPGQDRVPEQ